MEFEKLLEKIKEYTFCYSRVEGQGYALKTECQCHMSGKRDCEAIKEKDVFHNLYRQMDKQGHSREEIISCIKEMYNWEETKWIQYNVVE